MSNYKNYTQPLGYSSEEEEDEITKLEKQLNQIHSQTNELWYSVIVPYLSHPATSQVLTKLKNCSTDRQLFCEFMLKNNASYNMLLNHLTKLKSTSTSTSTSTTQVEQKE